MKQAPAPPESDPKEGTGETGSPGADRGWRPTRSIPYLVTMWVVFACGLAFPIFLALSPGSKGLAYLSELDAVGWVVLLLVAFVWVLVAAVLLQQTRAWLHDRR